MSNKANAVILIIYSDDLKPIISPSLDLMISQGNSTLLVTQKEQTPLQVFKDITSLSQLSDDESHQAIIEKNFFRRTAHKFNDIFHNGGFKKVQVHSNSTDVLQEAERYGMGPSNNSEETLSQIKMHDLTILMLVEPSSEDIEKILATLNSIDIPLLKYVAISQFPISRDLLTPQHGNPLLSSLVPTQTYLHIASENLDIEKDIQTERAVLLIESDQEYMRIDHFKTLVEITKATSDRERVLKEGNPFLYKYQHIGSFMKQVAFKLGKMEKFGA